MGLFDENGLDSYFGDYAGLANPYQDDSGSMGLQDPFPMQDFRTNQISSMLNPQGGSAIDSIPDVMNQIGSGVQQDPVLKRYFDLAAQGPPQREDYEPSLGRKILAAVGGLGYVFSDPKNAAKNTDAILDHPYDEAAGQYNANLKVAEDAAKSEGGLLNTGASIFRDVAQEENYRNLAGNRAGGLNYKYDALDAKNANNAQVNAIRQKIADNQALYNAGKLSAEEYRNQTGRLNYQLQQAQSQSLIDARTATAGYENARTDNILSGGPISGSRSTGPTVNKPNAAYQNSLMNNELASDPLVGKYYSPAAGGFLPGLERDPAAFARYQAIRAKYTGRDQVPVFNSNPLGFNTGAFGLPNDPNDLGDQ